MVLYDNREGSSTYGKVNEFFMGDYNPMLISIPKGVIHGFKCIGETEAIVINCPSEVYNYEDPDEFRIDPHNSDIPYDWTDRDS